MVVETGPCDRQNGGALSRAYNKIAKSVVVNFIQLINNPEEVHYYCHSHPSKQLKCVLFKALCKGNNLNSDTHIVKSVILFMQKKIK